MSNSPPPSAAVRCCFWWRGRVALVAPSGKEAVPHDRAGGSRDNLIATFATDTTPALAGLSGEEMQGCWVLRVSDHAGRDVGKLNRWALELAR